MSEQLVIIPDIHGRYDLLMKKLKEIEEGPYKSFRLAFLGDMVDRGPDSFLVVKTIKELVESRNAIALCGNHENMMLDYYMQKVPDKNSLWIQYNGGRRTVDSYTEAMKTYGFGRFFEAAGKSGHIQWLRTLPLFYESDKIWLSHAPVPKKEYREGSLNSERDYRIDVHALTWSYPEGKGIDEETFAHDHGKLAICGHIHALSKRLLKVRVYEKIIYADAGCGCWPFAPLSSIVVEDGRVLDVRLTWPDGLTELEAEKAIRGL